jgi:uncharacterized protein YndB with AHSA1/START domain
MGKGKVAHAVVVIRAPIEKVWDALVNPETIKQYMFGTQVSSDWAAGSAILWKGEWQGKRYEDRGVILQVEPRRRLQYTHFSPLSGLPDVPENYHTVTIDLSSEPLTTRVSLSQDNNLTDQARDHSEKNWHMMLGSLKTLLEKP